MSAKPAPSILADPASGAAWPLLLALLEQVPVGLLLVRGAVEQRIEFANQRAANLLGLAPAALAGRSILDVAPLDSVFDEHGQPLWPEDWPLTRALLRGESTQQENLRLARRDGRELWLKFCAAPLRLPGAPAATAEPLALLLLQDITREHELAELFQRLNHELERKSMVLERTERLLNGALAQAPLIVLMIDVPELTVHLLNDYGKRYFGLGDAEYQAQVLGRMLHELCECPLRSVDGLALDWDLLPPVRAALEGELIEAEDLLLTGADGGERRLSCSAAPIRDERGAIVAAIGLAIDITAQRAAEAQRRALLARIKDSERLEALGVMSGSFAHDFNNLLATIVGHNDMAQSLLDPDHPIQADLGAIASASERAADIIKRMLALSGSNVAMRLPVDLAALVLDEVQAQRPALPPGIHLIIDLAPELPPLHGDRSALRQLVSSLLGNAVEVLHGMSGELLVALHLRTLQRAPGGNLIEGDFQPGRYLQLTIADDGTGMEADTLNRALEPFSSPRLQSGGLGLAAVRGTVRAHRGVLSIETAPNQGMRATVLLPV